MMLPLGVERDELHVRHRVGLGEAAHDLALDDHRVDPHAAVVDRDDPEHVPHAGLRVDLDRGDVAGERPGQVGRVVVGVVLEAGLHAVGHVGVRGHRALLDGHAARGGAAHVEAPELPLDVLLRHLQQVGGQLAGLGPDLARDHRGRGAGDRRASATRRCPCRTACCRCRRARRGCRPPGCPSSWVTIWANVVSWPWPWVLEPILRIALPVGCTRSSAASNILMPRMSYSRLLPAPSGSVIVEMPMPRSRPRALRLGLLRWKSS